MLLAWLVGVALVVEAMAQAGGLFVTVPRIDSRAFPQVTAYVTVADQNGLPVEGLTAADFSLREDGTPVPPADITVEPATISGLYLVLGIDLSTPDENMALVKTAAKAFVDTLRPDDKLALVAFYDEVTLVSDFTNNTETLKAAIDSLSYKGNYTAVNEVIFESAEMISKFPVGRKAIILLPDIKNNIDTLPVDNAINKVREVRVPLFIVSFRNKAQPGDFKGISTAIGGASSIVFPSAHQVQGRLLEIGEQLRQGYRVTFRSNLPADNAEHMLKVDAAYQDLAGQAEGPFIAVPNEVIVTLPGLTDGQTVSGVINLTAQVTAPAPVESVEYVLENQSLQTVTTPPFSFDWDSTAVVTGPHTLLAEAVDNAGNRGRAEVDLNVVSPLVVTITAADTEIELGDEVSVQARIEAIAEVSRVDLLLDGELLNRNNTLPTALSFSSADYMTGTHVVTVRAEDSRGYTAEDSVSLQFLPPPPSPPSKLWWWLRLLAALLLMAILLAILILLLLWLLRRKPKPQTYALEIANRGNAPGQFKLRAEDRTGALQFVFAWRGRPLQTEQVAPVAAGPAVTVAATPVSRPATRQAKPASRNAAKASLPHPAQPLEQASNTLGCISAAMMPFFNPAQRFVLFYAPFCGRTNPELGQSSWVDPGQYDGQN